MSCTLKMNRHLLFLLLSLTTTFSFAQISTSKVLSSRLRVDLKGQWQFAFDTGNVGIKERWFSRELSEQVLLPGTTDLNKKGHVNKDATTMHLSRVYRYEGAAWYRKRIIIPTGFNKKHISLFLERTKSSKIWIDGVLIGSSAILQSPQQFDLSKYLSPGAHDITIRIDNTLKLTPYGNVHIYSDDAQTNWNGIIGAMYLEATDKTFINNLQVDPDLAMKTINVKLGIQNHAELKNVVVDLLVEKTENGKTEQLKTQQIKTAGKALLNFTYNLGDDASFWDEYEHPLYKITAVISGKNIRDEQSASFGMRKFATKGTQFTINDRVTFLRGKHDAAVFPLTGHPPMEVEGWIKIFNIAKSYGINHYRFHSWSPPAAAFTAADQVGMYLQVELPFWGGLDNDTLANALRAEGIAMLKHFANHPSFVLFSHGNEIWGGHERIEKNILAFKAYDSRPLYTMGSNVNIGYFPLQQSSDFFVGTRTQSKGDTVLTHTRLTHAFADSKEGGTLNGRAPSTEINYTYPVSQMQVPIISHEIGQYQIYPDYKEIDKYTGVVEARNLEVFRDRLKKAGMMDQNMDFQKASGAWAALCYKAEMEAAIRTRGFGGFQLLDLQDFPGQGTALVGILDAFMDSKNVISREEWLKSCNDVVLMLEFPKFVWTNKETFHAKAEIANYSNKNLDQQIGWVIRTQKGEIIQEGTFNETKIDKGGLNTIGEINVPLAVISKAEKLTVDISTKDGTYKNSYPIWVYPQDVKKPNLKGIIVATKLDEDVFKKLQKGGKVLLFPQTEALKDNAVPGLFPPEFWNWGMFKSISESNKKPVSPGTLGLLTDPQHPVFRSFPTDFHTSWQWYTIIKASNSLILDQTAKHYRPIVQVIDNLERNHKMGMIFEFKVGAGKLLVCTSQLNLIMEKPEAQQLYKSLVNYMQSDDFKPAHEMSREKLKALKL
jgi:hypothetical protein